MAVTQRRWTQKVLRKLVELGRIVPEDRTGARVEAIRLFSAAQGDFLAKTFAGASDETLIKTGIVGMLIPLLRLAAVYGLDLETAFEEQVFLLEQERPPLRDTEIAPTMDELSPWRSI